MGDLIITRTATGVDLADSTGGDVTIDNLTVTGTLDLAGGDVDARLDALEAVDPWHVVGTSGNPGLQNGWTMLAGREIAFRKDSQGNVHIHGVVVRTSGTDGAAIFTLPVGYRPTRNFTNASTTTSNSPIRTECLTTGTVHVQGATSAVGTYVFIAMVVSTA